MFRQIVLGILLAAVVILIIMMIVFLINYKKNIAPVVDSSSSTLLEPEPEIVNEETSEPTDDVAHESVSLETEPPVIENTPRPVPDRPLPSDNVETFQGELIASTS